MSSKTINMNFDEMGKTELRAACKAAGISYAKLTVGGMRAAVKAAYAQPEEPEVTTVAETPLPLVLNAMTTAAREERNGVKRPKAGGLCAAVWEALDSLLAAGIEPATKDVRALAEERRWNLNNATAELSAWRKFNGISRSVLKAATKAVQPVRRIDGEIDQYIA